MISVLVPTRNRPASVRRLLDSATRTADTDVEFIFYTDDDDDSVMSWAKHYDDDARVFVAIGPRVVLSEMWNHCATIAKHDIMMHCGDDIVFRTDGWDVKVLEEFDRWPDKIVFVHGRDGFQDAKIGTHGFLHRNWVNTVGYLVPPYFSSDYNDLWLTEVADTLGRRRYLKDVYTEHMHPIVGKGSWDLTHRERLERHKRDNVDRLYRRHEGDRVRDVQKLREFIHAYGGDA